MNIELRNKGNKAAKIWLASFLGLIIYLFIFPPNENIWETSQVIPIALIAVGAISFWVFIWFYIMAKGYPKIFAVIGILVFTIAPYLAIFLIFLPDRFPVEY